MKNKFSDDFNEIINGLLTTCSNEVIISELSSKDLEFLDKVHYINKKFGRPVSCADFSSMKSNYRQKIRNLKPFLEYVFGKNPKYWKIKGVELAGDSHRLTNQPMSLGNYFEKVLEDLAGEKPCIHDIKASFSCPELFDCFFKIGKKPHPQNKSIIIEIPSIDNNISAKILVYPSKIQVNIGNTYLPFSTDIMGIITISSILGRIHDYLSRISGCYSIPPIHKWVFTHYHLNKDGPAVCGKTFELRWDEIASGCVRFYSKKMLDGTIKPRLEQIKTEKTTLAELALVAIRK